MFLRMQAVILAIFGISELQRRKASPVHICRALELKAKLDKVVTVEMESARPSVKPIVRMVLMRVAVMWASRCSMARLGPSRRTTTVINRTFGAEARCGARMPVAIRLNVLTACLAEFSPRILGNCVAL